MTSRGSTAIDTNVLSEPIRPRPDESVVERMRQHEEFIAIPAPVWHELVHGCLRLPQSRRRAAIEGYLFETLRPSFAIVAYDAQAAQWHARERARLAAEGLTPPYVDGQIAAIAAVNGFTLVTANLKDFSSFRGLEVERWHDAGD